MNTAMPGAGSFDLLHLVGFLTGAVLYGMLIVMVARPPARADNFALSTGLLGLVWNVGELAAYAARLAGLGLSISWIHAFSFTALGLLASVVVHSVARAPVRLDIPAAHRRQCGRRCRLCLRHVRGRDARRRCCHRADIALIVRADGVDDWIARGDSCAHHGRETTTQCSSCAVDGCPRGGRRLGAAPRAPPWCAGIVAGGTHRPSRVDRPGVRDPVSGLPIRIGGPVS